MKTENMKHFLGLMTVLPVTVLVILPLFTEVNSQCFSKNDRVAVPSPAEFSSVAVFGLDLHKEMFPSNGTSGNYVISPYALWKSLTLAYFGSSGNTQKQLEQLLDVSDKISALKVWSYLDRLYESEKNNTPTMLVDARAFVSERRTLRPCVETILEKALVTQDFSNIYKAAIEINSWISASTKGHVRSLYQPNELLGSNMLLASTGIHKGSWLFPFKTSASRSQPFYFSSDGPVDVTTMTQKGHFNYGESADLGAQILELPFEGGIVSMFVMLPPLNSGSVGILNTLKSLNSITLTKALLQMQHAVIRVVLPKFKFLYETDLDLKQALIKMGVTDLFDKESANLNIFSPSGNLNVGHITHKAYIEIDEGGVSGASAKNFPNSFRPTGPLKQRVFVCNRPFVFALMDKVASRILFIGVFRDPRN